MGRPLGKRFFGADANSNIKVHFHNGTAPVKGYIVKQLSSNRWRCKDVDGNIADCKLVVKDFADIAAKEMTITVKYDNGSTAQIEKISEKLVTVNGVQRHWTFDPSTSDGYVQIDEAGTNTAMANDTDLEGVDVTLVSISVTPGNSSHMTTEGTVQFTATGTYSDSSTANLTTSVTWTSNTPAKATIGAHTGLATLVAAGSTTISAALGEISGSTTLTVTTGFTWTAPSGFHGYLDFNGTNQRLSTPGSADFAPGTGAFTVECVMNFDTGGGSFPRLFSVGTYPGASVACSLEGGQVTGQPHIYFWIHGQVACSVSTSTLTGMPSFLGNWHHVVLQRDGTGKCNIYIDGNKVATGTNTYNLTDSTSALDICTEHQAGGSYTNWLKAKITNFRWTNSAVYPDSNFAVMSAELTALSGTKLLLAMTTSGAALTDTSTSAHTVTGTGSPVYSSYP
jgi:Concanavalin A-like lectin/glucanases superfamily/Bacterial Ig-like domain (group 2)